MAQPLHLNLTCQNGPTLISDHVRTHPIVISEWPSVPDWTFLVTDQVPPFSQRMGSTLISDQVGTNPSITSEWPCTHIWSSENTSHSHIKTALSPRLSFPSNSPGSSIPRMEIALISDHVGTNPTIISKWLSTHIWHGRNQSSHHDKMAQFLHLTY